MSANSKLKEAYDVASKHGAFYTGGNIEWHQEILLCQTSASVSVLNVDDGTVLKSIGEENDDDADSLQTFTSDGIRLVTSHKSGLLKMWTLDGVLVKIWKYIHKGPIASMCLKDGLLLSGGSDGTVRVWDIEHQTCVFGLRGCTGVVSVVQFHSAKKIVFASGDDGQIATWNAVNGTNLHTYTSHYSKVTSIVFTNDDQHFISCGRDKVIILWKIEELKPLKTIPLYENVESIVILPPKFRLPHFKSDPVNIYVASGGENGIVRIWQVNNSKEVYKQSNSLVSKGEDGALAITKLLIKPDTKTLAVVTAEQNIILHQLKSFVCLKQFIGFSDEILDLAIVGKDESHLAVATNSADIKLYDNSTMSCQLLRGHTDLVLALTVSKFNPDLMLSSGKDNKVLLWTFEGVQMICLASGLRHTGSVGALAVTNTSTKFLVSGSEDRCLKLWEIPAQLNALNCIKTELAHEKDINCVAISPNDKIIASASQDKIAKIWTENLTLVGSLKGHKRGIWCVQFSPVDQVVVTSSADCTLKLWSVTDLSCLKTIEGHEASALKVAFISNGLQLISSGADGLVKLFDVKTSECCDTFDQHDGKIWAMVLNRSESMLITGGSDSLLVKWKDVTEERKQQRLAIQEEETEHQQKLANYVQNGHLLKALKLALKLDRPKQVLQIVKGIVKQGEIQGLTETISSLRNDQKENLLKCATSWNTNSRSCQSAQTVFDILVKEMQSGDFKPVSLSGVLEGALPYTERHFKRLTQLLQDLYLIKYTMNCMQPHAKDI